MACDSVRTNGRAVSSTGRPSGLRLNDAALKHRPTVPIVGIDALIFELKDRKQIDRLLEYRTVIRHH